MRERQIGFGGKEQEPVTSRVGIIYGFDEIEATGYILGIARKI